jgi:hypothetical protein
MASKDMSFLGLNRPEYVPIPEVFISAIAWSLARRKERVEFIVGGEPADGLAYARRDAGAKQTKMVTATSMPKQGDERHDALVASLVSSLQIDASKAVEAAKVILQEIEVRAGGSLRSAAVPLTLELALLQDVPGVTGKKNPANYALLVEQFFTLGGGKGRAADLWLGSLNDAKVGAVPGWLNDAVKVLIPAGCTTAAEAAHAGLLMDTVAPKAAPEWLNQLEENPFRWFAVSWTNLCKQGWIDAMPRRRWTDWATCLLRTTFGSGFLFEAHLMQSMTCALVSDEAPDDVVSTMLDTSRRLLPWDELQSRPARDVKPVIMSLSANAAACQGILEWLGSEYADFPQPDKFYSSPTGLQDWLSAARAVVTGDKAKVQQRIAERLDAATTKGGAGKNIYLTILYSLLGRGAFAEDDLYGVIQSLGSAGRMSCVEPGQEWLVAIASLASRKPQQLSRLGDLTRALHSIGIAPSIPMLVRKLESYGLARSSHDADEAVEIQPAF